MKLANLALSASNSSCAPAARSLRPTMVDAGREEILPQLSQTLAAPTSLRQVTNHPQRGGSILAQPEGLGRDDLKQKSKATQSSRSLRPPKTSTTAQTSFAPPALDSNRPARVEAGSQGVKATKGTVDPWIAPQQKNSKATQEPRRLSPHHNATPKTSPCPSPWIEVPQ